jgi:YbbR domain-containing protein
MFSFPKEKFFEKEYHKEFFFALVERIFLRDWGTKLIALGITLAIWFGVNGMRENATVTLKNVPLNLRVSNDMEITNSPNDEVELVIKLNSRDLVITKDLSAFQSGAMAIPLTPETVNLDLPAELKLEMIRPNKIAIKLEKVLEREVEVKPEFEDLLPEGMEIYNKSVFPSKVRVRGPESIVKQLDSISTEKISLGNRKEAFSAKQIGLNVVNSKITLLDTIVDVNILIGEKRIERIFTIEAKEEGALYSVSIILLASRATLEKIKPQDIQVSIGRTEDGKPDPIITLPFEFQDQIEVKSKKIG